MNCFGVRVHVHHNRGHQFSGLQKPNGTISDALGSCDDSVVRDPQTPTPGTWTVLWAQKVGKLPTAIGSLHSSPSLGVYHGTSSWENPFRKVAILRLIFLNQTLLCFVQVLSNAPFSRQRMFTASNVGNFTHPCDMGAFGHSGNSH